MELKEAPEFIEVVMKNVPNQLQIMFAETRYGSEDLNIGFGLYEKHTSLRKFIKNLKQIYHG